ncbi:hypothetical protein PsorP6_003946 [Peronosclerospora sorghi]|uniref:Uncharacterized protein n=1 Tax=Peronosclerospora sorghi TaxID=230839 RepID=A0ACC0VL11_9STRA|nr:hypothetical protein PsorP6_003946 [Peronosclerospora sorghi]
MREILESWSTQFAMLERFLKLNQSRMAWTIEDNDGGNIPEETVQKITGGRRWTDSTSCVADRSSVQEPEVDYYHIESL